MVVAISSSTLHGKRGGGDLVHSGQARHFLQNVVRNYEAQSSRLTGTVDALGDALRGNSFQLAFHRRQAEQLSRHLRQHGADAELAAGLALARQRVDHLSLQDAQLRGQHQRAVRAESAALAMAARIRHSVDAIEAKRGGRTGQVDPGRLTRAG
ncbi:MAG: hypothetical protein V4754_00200 [Pseudomonadota bacterium]